MKLLTLAVALSLAALGACERKAAQPPSPKTDSSSSVPQAAGGSSTAPDAGNKAAAGSSTTPANAGNPSSGEKKDGANPVQGQVDPKHADQHRDFQQQGDGRGPTSADTRPTIKN